MRILVPRVAVGVGVVRVGGGVVAVLLGRGVVLLAVLVRVLRGFPGERVAIPGVVLVIRRVRIG